MQIVMETEQMLSKELAYSYFSWSKRKRGKNQVMKPIFLLATVYIKILVHLKK